MLNVSSLAMNFLTAKFESILCFSGSEKVCAKLSAKDVLRHVREVWAVFRIFQLSGYKIKF